MLRSFSNRRRTTEEDAISALPNASSLDIDHVYLLPHTNDEEEDNGSELYSDNDEEALEFHRHQARRLQRLALPDSKNRKKKKKKKSRRNSSKERTSRHSSKKRSSKLNMSFEAPMSTVEIHPVDYTSAPELDDLIDSFSKNRDPSLSRVLVPTKKKRSKRKDDSSSGSSSYQSGFSSSESSSDGMGDQSIASLASFASFASRSRQRLAGFVKQKRSRKPKKRETHIPPGKPRRRKNRKEVAAVSGPYINLEDDSMNRDKFDKMSCLGNDDMSYACESEAMSRRSTTSSIFGFSVSSRSIRRLWQRKNRIEKGADCTETTAESEMSIPRVVGISASTSNHSRKSSARLSRKERRKHSKKKKSTEQPAQESTAVKQPFEDNMLSKTEHIVARRKKNRKVKQDLQTATMDSAQIDFLNSIPSACCRPLGEKDPAGFDVFLSSLANDSMNCKTEDTLSPLLMDSTPAALNLTVDANAPVKPRDPIRARSPMRGLPPASPSQRRGKGAYAMPSTMRVDRDRSIPILLLDPVQKVFEIVSIGISREMTVGEALKSACATAADRTLKNQTYISLCNDTKVVHDLSTPVHKLRVRKKSRRVRNGQDTSQITDDESLSADDRMKRQMERTLMVAVPDNASPADCKKVRRILWKNPKLQAWWQATSNFRPLSAPKEFLVD